jgi:uncharacterized Zn-binding protein involved in type VI secretion
MPAVQRLEDANNGGGKLTETPQDFVTVDGKKVAVVGAKGTSHRPCGDPGEDVHCYPNWHTTVGSSKVRISNKPVIRRDDPDSCGHTRIGGSGTVRVGG